MLLNSRKTTSILICMSCPEHANGNADRLQIYFNNHCNNQRLLYSVAMDATSVIAALNALAHEHRLAVFRLLVQAGPGGLSAGTISGEIGTSPATMSFHLKDLVRALLIDQRHEGRKIFYSARFETMNGLLRYLTDNCCGGNPCSPVYVPGCVTSTAPS